PSRSSAGRAPMATILSDGVTLRVKSPAPYGVLDWPPTSEGGFAHEAQRAYGARDRGFPWDRTRDRAGPRRGGRRRRRQLRVERRGRQGSGRADPQDGTPVAPGPGRRRRLPGYVPDGAGPPQGVRPPRHPREQRRDQLRQDFREDG